jgi:hypothetical protein
MLIGYVVQLMLGHITDTGPRYVAEDDGIRQDALVFIPAVTALSLN